VQPVPAVPTRSRSSRWSPDEPRGTSTCRNGCGHGGSNRCARRRSRPSVTMTRTGVTGERMFRRGREPSGVRCLRAPAHVRAARGASRSSSTAARRPGVSPLPGGAALCRCEFCSGRTACRFRLASLGPLGVALSGRAWPPPRMALQTMARALRLPVLWTFYTSAERRDRDRAMRRRTHDARPPLAAERGRERLGWLDVMDVGDRGRGRPAWPRRSRRGARRQAHPGSSTAVASRSRGGARERLSASTT
jgi:hypothetical protein